MDIIVYIEHLRQVLLLLNRGDGRLVGTVVVLLLFNSGDGQLVGTVVVFVVAVAFDFYIDGGVFLVEGGQFVPKVLVFDFLFVRGFPTI